MNVHFLLIESIGIALLYLRLATLFPAEKDNYKAKAKSLIDSSLERLSGKIDVWIVRENNLDLHRSTNFFSGW